MLFLDVSVRLNEAVGEAGLSDACLSIEDKRRIAMLKCSDLQAALSDSLKWERCALEQLAKPVVTDEVVLQKPDAGAPFLLGHPEVSVSISRSVDVSMVGLSVAGQVGVDVERVRSIAYEPILDMIATDAEAAYVSEADQELRFFRLWTIKEAVLKAMGVGLAGGARNISVPDAVCGEDGRGFVQTPTGECEVSVEHRAGIVSAIAILRQPSEKAIENTAISYIRRPSHHRLP